jgi:hypothetical protein
MLTSAAVAAVSPTLPSSASVVVATAILLVLVLVLVVHFVPLLGALLPALGRRAWRVVLALAAVDLKEVDVAVFNLQFCFGPILHLFHNF